MNRKIDFINQEIRLLSFNAAFQHAGVYNNNISDTDKGYMRNMMFGEMSHMLDQYKERKKPMSDEEHIENLLQLQKYSENFGVQFKEGHLRFGIIQKLFNLFLKYHWCLGNIDTPPHFPIDRIIQQKLEIQPLIAWTQLTSVDEYKRIINFAKDYLADKSNLASENCNSLAELELKLFERRN
jgi:hypothetical protein